jgi:phosphohistidine phosphatase
MELYVVRHGEAGAAAPGGDDGGRSLTERGRQQVAGVGTGLRSLGVVVDRILASPLRRARETADILARELAGAAKSDEPIRETVAALDGNSPPATMLDALGHLGRDEVVAVVGHMPGLGELVTLATSGIGAAGIPLGTASVARIDFDGRPRAGAGQLRWLMSAEQLALLRRGRSDDAWERPG